MKKFFGIVFFLLANLTVLAQEPNPLIATDDFENQKKWVDSIYNSMTIDQKLGQLFMADVFSSDSRARLDKIKTLISDYHLGGIIFSKGGPVRQARLTNEFQSLSKTPLLIGMDAEWGLAMRLDSTYAFPWNMTLGAITDTEIIEKIGNRIGTQAKRLGVHIDFAPVVDINNNPENPIIGNRSFGEDRLRVTERATAFLKGMKRAGVMGSAKHFPGHGDTNLDSHNTLPLLDFSRERLDSIELYPYRKMIENNLGSVMVGHLRVPALEKKSENPSSLSYEIVTGLLKEKMKFNGLIVTDALNMQGASRFKNPGEVELAAFLAGNDVLVIPKDVPGAIDYLKEAYEKNTITEKRLAHSVKKILYAKYKLGLHAYKPVQITGLVEDLNTVYDDLLYEEAMEKALTVLKNDQAILPVKNLEKKKIAYVNFGDDSGAEFLSELRKYADVKWIRANNLNSYKEKLKDFNYVIIGFHKNNDNPWRDYKFSERELVWLYEIARTNTVILNVFARPYALLDLKSTANFEGIVISYQNSIVSQQLSAQLIFGAREASGKLPVSLGVEFPVNSGLETKSLKRLQYGIPESVGMNSYKLQKIDSLARKGLREEMFPGAQILVARRGKVIYNKSFGFHDYKKDIRVTDSTVYDLASLTKILATLPLVMELVDSGELGMDTRIAEMLPEYKDSNKASVTIKRMLSHYARFQPWIPFFRPTLNTEGTGVSSEYYSAVPTKDFSIHVADDLYMRNDYKDSIYQQIKDSRLLSRQEYRYSDLPFYILKKYLEQHYAKPFNILVQERLYESLGANYSLYNPLTRFPKEQIPPTEMDLLFRNQKVQGYVHDQGAAMMGGLGGHAGLFANANDVAKIMQMFLWKGYYGGKRFFRPEVVDEFNTCYFCEKRVRRGVGFDKPQLGNSGPTCGCVSMTSFGHSGFTGTFTWADPEEEIVYVFLSNRTFPDASNTKLIRSNLRSDIQEAIYAAIEN